MRIPPPPDNPAEASERSCQRRESARRICTEAGVEKDEEATGLTVSFGGKDGLTGSIAVDLSGHDFGYYEPCQGLAAGDFDGDGVGDLVMSFEDKVAWVAGGSGPRQPDGWAFTTIDDEVEPGGEGHFASVDAGDIDGDEKLDLSYTVTGCETCDEAHVAYRTVLGDGRGSFTRDAEWSILTEGMPELLEPVIGDVDGDGFDDVVVGAPNTGSDADDQGRVELWYGTSDGLDVDSDPVRIDQDTRGIPGTGESGDRFGAAVSLDDTDGDGYADLAIGVPGEDSSEHEDAGRMVLVPGGRDGADTANASGVNQDSRGIPGSIEPYDRFGTFVEHRPVPGRNNPGLLVGAPGENDRIGRAYVLAGEDASWFAPEEFGIREQDSKFGS